MEIRFDLPAERFDPAARIGVRGEHVGFAAVVVRVLQGRDDEFTRPARHRPQHATPVLGAKTGRGHHARADRHDAVHRRGLTIPRPHLPHRVGHQAHVVDEAVFVVVPAHGKDLGAIARAQVAHDMRHPLARDLVHANGHLFDHPGLYIQM
jgi:hypothetical protein